jgi:hypothetical protein
MAKTPDKNEASVEEAPPEPTDEDGNVPVFTEQRQQDPLPESEDVGEGRFPGDPNTYPDPENLPHAY